MLHPASHSLLTQPTHAHPPALPHALQVVKVRYGGVVEWEEGENRRVDIPAQALLAGAGGRPACTVLAPPPHGPQPEDAGQAEGTKAAPAELQGAAAA